MVISNLIIFSLLLVLLRVIYTRTQKLGITVLIGLLLGVILRGVITTVYNPNGD
ncbi:hypothetical protein AAUPMC_03709 [Pasteurella multocida subsp. multocida str. Anand1_cattle]|nr:hypothetical protein AAUPMC_03709 [Pasteurella multocida subsp. multocida str. Anand1_cattle]